MPSEAGRPKPPFSTLVATPPASDSAPSDPAGGDLESAVRARGEALFARMDQVEAPSLFSKKGLYGSLMDWAMKDEAFKTQLFRFVDVLPSLKSSGEIVRHLQEYLGDRAVELSPAMKAGLSAAAFAPALVAGPVKANVTSMARQFLVGETPAELAAHLRRRAKDGIATTVDLLGELVVSEAEADAFLERNLAMLGTVSRELARDAAPCFSDLGPRGPLPRLNLSVKISALTPDLHPCDPEGGVENLKRRLRAILRRAAEVGAFVNFDMESTKLKAVTLELFRSVFSEPEFREKPAAGIAIQAYLRDVDPTLHELVAWARAVPRLIGVRLVKGAYWDFETITAAQRGWPSPVWSHKAESDLAYERATCLLLDHADLIAPAFASHNVRSCAHAIVQAERRGLDSRAIEFQMLFGMADELKAALVQSGFRVREYSPVGELLPGMAYFVRRLLENTSNEGFVRAKATGETARATLLESPGVTLSRMTNSGSGNPSLDIRRPSFANAPNTDFTLAQNRDRMRAALRDGSAAFGRRWPLVIGGKKVSPREFLPSVNPSHPAQVVGHWAKATVADAEAALAAARAAFPGWARTPAAERAAVFERAAGLMEQRRFTLNALLVHEGGKPWMEADGDVSEAIDFCRFYAHEMRALDRPAITQRTPGELNHQLWTPRGTGVVIAPWNFPLAILCGMTVAAAVAGNTVVMKPAEQTSVIGAVFMDVLTEAGLPPGVVNLLTGLGEEVGAHLVAHRDTDFIAFTGSRAVGTAIWETAGRTVPGQRNLKKVVCEMGGKNAIVVDSDADLDEAIPAILHSAFGFAGQKCSACSRLIVLDAVHDELVTRLVAAAASLRVGPAEDPGTVVGPVIDDAARAKIESLIEVGTTEATLAFRGAAAAGDGWFVPSAVFTHVAPDARIAQEEIFGPVLAVIRARHLDEAFAIANGTAYALTGGFFSRSPTALERARREFQVGNLYLNRGCTGAIVERHPFGGFKMSGGGTKAGGRGYLENFLFPRAVSENTLRRGFTPPEE